MKRYGSTTILMLIIPLGIAATTATAKCNNDTVCGRGENANNCPVDCTPAPPGEDPILATFTMTLTGPIESTFTNTQHTIFGTVPSSVRHQNPDPMNGDRLIFFGCGGGQSAGTFCPGLDTNGECCNQLSLSATFTMADSAVEPGTPCADLDLTDLAHSPQFAEPMPLNTPPSTSDPTGLLGDTRNTGTILIEDVGSGNASVSISFRGVDGDGTVLSKGYELDLDGTFVDGPNPSAYPPAQGECVNIDLQAWDLSAAGKGKKTADACVGSGTLDGPMGGHSIKLCRIDTPAE